KTSPVQSRTNRACWRASSVPAKVVIQTSNDAGSHGVSICGSPSCATVASTTTACGESRLLWKGPVASATPHHLPDFWESAVARHCGSKPREDEISRPFKRLTIHAQWRDNLAVP